MADWRQELQDKLFPKERAIGVGGSGGRKWSKAAKKQFCRRKYENGDLCNLPIRGERIGATRCDLHRADENLGCASHDKLNCPECEPNVTLS